MSSCRFLALPEQVIAEKLIDHKKIDVALAKKNSTSIGRELQQSVAFIE